MITGEKESGVNRIHTKNNDLASHQKYHQTGVVEMSMVYNFDTSIRMIMTRNMYGSVTIRLKAGQNCSLLLSYTM